MDGCITLKRFIEQNKLKVYSKAFLRELKCFVARGNSFSAQPGETDDLVMSMVIACRMVNYISTFEDDIFDVVNQNIRGDGELDPMMSPLTNMMNPMPNWTTLDKYK